MLKESLSLAGVDYDSVEIIWPNIFDRFKEIDKEVEYRTVYAALCSQAHNDAEDALNQIMARVVRNVEGLDEAHWYEQYFFSLYLALTAIDYHIMASAMYLSRFKIDAMPLIDMKKKVHEATENVVEHGAKTVRNQILVKENL